MIERLQVIATHLRRFRLLIALSGLLSLLLLLLGLLDSSRLAGEDLIIPSLLCFTWAIALLSFSGVFARVPKRPAAGASWRVRLGYKIRRAMMWSLVLLMLVLGAALVVLTLKLLRTGTVG